MPLRKTIIQLLPNQFYFLSEAFLFLLFKAVSTFTEEPCSHHDINCIINPAFDVSGVIRLAGEVIYEDTANMVVLEATIAIKQSCQFARNKLQALDLFPICLTLLLKPSP